MFGFGWSEIAVIGVVALVCIGPKDMPVAMKALAGIVRKMRRMAAEFQTHVDDMMREADLHEVQSTLREIRGLSPRGVIDRYVDPDGSVRGALADPFREHPVPPVAGRPVADRPAVPPISGRPVADRPPVSPIPGPQPDFLPPRTHGSVASGPAPDFVPPHQAGAAMDRADDL